MLVWLLMWLYVVYSKKSKFWQCSHNSQPHSFMMSMLTVNYWSLLFSVVLTCWGSWGHQRHNIFDSFYVTLNKWSGWNLIRPWRRSNWATWYPFKNFFFFLKLMLLQGSIQEATQLGCWMLLVEKKKCCKGAGVLEAGWDSHGCSWNWKKAMVLWFQTADPEVSGVGFVRYPPWVGVVLAHRLVDVVPGKPEWP